MIEITMISTIIVILLAAVAIFWKAPFPMAPIYGLVRRRWRWILFILLLISLFTAQTHTSAPPAGFSNKEPLGKCKRELQISKTGVTNLPQQPTSFSPAQNQASLL
jgi:hypothetical protein